MIEKYITLANGSPVIDGAVKVASGCEEEIHIPPEIEEYVARLKADPRFAYMHTIAMSDGDSYGTNLNGDIFTWDELCGRQAQSEADRNDGDLRGCCLPRFKTFEQARFFRRHDNRPDSPFYGDVPLAVLNMPMRRIELIVRVARQNIPELGMSGAPDIAQALDDGRSRGVSMGCKIHHEKCTFCGNENELISQRCPHLRHQMNEIMPNGVKVGALNYGMRFFDLSDVIIPADPIAMSLSKVASCPSKKPNKARDVKTAEPWRSKWSEMTKEIPADSVGATCQECETSEFQPEEFTDGELKKAMEMCTNDVDTVVSTATLAGIVFSPRELAKLSQYMSTDDAILGLSGVALDRFNYSVYDVFQSKLASRSGFLAPCPRSGWDPVKLAEAGHRDVGDYYAFYRCCLSSLPAPSFAKAANVTPPIRNLLGSVAEHEPRLKAAMFYLARAGLDA